MIVYGNPKWPTVQTLRTHLTNIVGPPIAYGIEKEGVFGGTPKHFGYNQLLKLKESKIPTPEATNDYEQALEWYRNGYTLYARLNNHTQGRDIIRINPHPAIFSKKARQRDYWVRYYNSPGTPLQNQEGINLTIYEWRTHICKLGAKPQTIGVGTKIKSGNPTRQKNLRLVDEVRSRRNGWTMRLDIKPPKGVRPLARAAIEALGYDFGAVDIIDLGEDSDPRFMVLEVNSAPALRSPLTIERYTNAFKALAVDTD